MAYRPYVFSAYTLNKRLPETVAGTTTCLLLVPFVVSQDTERQWKGVKAEGDPCKLRL